MFVAVLLRVFVPLCGLSYYLGPATYCPFFCVLVSAPRSSVLITTRGTLVHAGKVEFPGEDTIGAPGEPLEWHEGEPTTELVPTPATTPGSAARGGCAFSARITWDNHVVSVAYVR